MANAAPWPPPAGRYSATKARPSSSTARRPTPAATIALTYLWTANAAGIDAGGTCSFDDATKKNAKVTCTDNGNGDPQLTATDDDGGSNSQHDDPDAAEREADDRVPTLPDGTALPTTIIVAGTLNIKVAFSDLATNDTHKAQIDCGARLRQRERRAPT